MSRARITILIWLIPFCLFGACAAASAAEGIGGIAGQVLMLSDLHFNPMADPPLVDRLAAAEPQNWRGIFESSNGAAISGYGQDTNWRLLRSVLLQARQMLPDAQFLVLPGDFLAHNFRQAFDAAAKEHSGATYRVFVRKTMKFLAQQLEDAFPNRPIVPALGNNDDVCGDFLLEPGGPFLADMLPILHSLIDGGGTSTGFDRGWVGYGNYSVKIHDIRIISVNTVFFSRRYRNACGSPGGPDPGQATLAWLEAELAAAKQAGEPVWLLYHVPPGVDGFTTLFRGSCPDDILPMWEAAYAQPFYALLRQYADSVVVSFAGHTHMDDFRLIGTPGGHYAFVLITPALSPIFGQNPAFRTVAYGVAGSILNETTYDLTNLREASSAPGAPPAWEAEYTFTREWSLPRIDLPSLERLYSQIQSSPAERDHWRAIFAVASPVYWPRVAGGDGGEAHAARAFSCASGNILLSDYRQCYCAAPQ